MLIIHYAATICESLCYNRSIKNKEVGLMKALRLLVKIVVISIIAIVGVIAVSSSYVYADSGGTTTTPDTTPDAQDENRQCASILFEWCNMIDGKGGEATIKEIIIFVISTLSIGIGTLGTVGLIFCGYTIMTAKDDTAKVTKAKTRMIEIVIGVLVWALGAAAALLLVPDPEAASKLVNGDSVIRMKEIE